MINKQEWMQYGICRNQPQLFDPIPYGTRRTRHAEKRSKAALDICNTCPVIEQCAHWALRNFDDDESIVGGMTGYERRQQRQKLGLAKPRIVLIGATRKVSA